MGAAEKLRPEEFDEAEAARRLGMGKSTLSRLRLMGAIRPMRLSPRKIRYTDAILDEYRDQCRNAPDKLETSGSASGEARIAGAERGTTRVPDRQSARRLAQEIFRKPS